MNFSVIKFKGDRGLNHLIDHSEYDNIMLNDTVKLNRRQ